MLIEAFDIPNWLERDTKLGWRERVRRDKKLLQLKSDNVNNDQLAQVLSWWSQLDKDNVQGPGKEIQSLFHKVSFTLIIIAAVSGVGLASALMHYDGSQPVNILMLLAWLVFVPLVFLLTSFLLPYIYSNSFLGGMNPGGIIQSLLKKNNPVVEELSSINSRNAKNDVCMRWQLMLYSQIFGLVLALFALLTVLLRVSFSDLAFGWSTTLTIEADTLAQWLRALAWPWSSWFAEAVPSLELIQQSRYFRLQGTRMNISAEALTHWWKYIVMCLLCYGVLLRLIVLLFTKLNYNRAIKSMLLHHPEVIALLDRMDTVLEDVQSDASQIVAGSNEGDLSEESIHSSADVIIFWNGARIEKLQHTKILIAGGENSLEQDARNLSEIKVGQGERICIVTKSWEPPLLEFHDYIKSLRAAVGENISILVQPVSEGGSFANTTDVEVWRHSISSMQDPKVYVP